jgi:hypothetical protein
MKRSPLKLLTRDELGEARNIRTPELVTTVKSDASGPHRLDLDSPQLLGALRRLPHPPPGAIPGDSPRSEMIYFKSLNREI